MTKIFISWSGAASHAVAKALHQWLPILLQSTKPFISSEDLRKGGRWGKELGEELQKTNFGIICLTPTNLTAPWILFETGALSKFVEESQVAPLLLGVKPSDLPSPLTQFNATTAEKADFYKLVKAINDVCQDQKLTEMSLETAFEALWPKIEESLIVATKTKENLPSKPSSSSDLDKLDAILQEILVLTRKNTQTLNSPEDLLPPAYLSHWVDRIRVQLADRTDADQIPRGAWQELSLRWKDSESMMSHPEVPAEIKMKVKSLRGPLEYILERYEYSSRRLSSVLARRRMQMKSTDEALPEPPESA